MPLYEYHCRKCHNDYEQFISMSAPPPPCPKCKAADTFKMISRTIAHTPSAFITLSEQERPPATDESGKCIRCSP